MRPNITDKITDKKTGARRSRNHTTHDISGYSAQHTPGAFEQWVINLVSSLDWDPAGIRGLRTPAGDFLLSVSGLGDSNGLPGYYDRYHADDAQRIRRAEELLYYLYSEAYLWLQEDALQEKGSPEAYLSIYPAASPAQTAQVVGVLDYLNDRLGRSLPPQLVFYNPHILLADLVCRSEDELFVLYECILANAVPKPHSTVEIRAGVVEKVETRHRLQKQPASVEVINYDDLPDTGISTRQDYEAAKLNLDASTPGKVKD